MINFRPLAHRSGRRDPDHVGQAAGASPSRGGAPSIPTRRRRQHDRISQTHR